VESKWRNFVHTPSFGVWKASGEILYTHLFLVFGKHGEKFCTFGEHPYIFECDQYLLEKRVYLKPLLLSISEVNLVFECFGISTSSV
jgi:hypothetical protein